MKKALLIGALINFLAVACYKPAPPPSPPFLSIGIVAMQQDGTQIAGAVVRLHEAQGYVEQVTGGIPKAPGLVVYSVPSSLHQTDLTIDAVGYTHFAYGPLEPVDGKNYFFALTPAEPPFPPPPSRDTLLHIVTSDMQGYFVTTQQFGTLPWWGAALWSLNDADRATVMAWKRANGDTSSIIGFDTWTGSIYDEGGNPYQQMHGRGFQNDIPGFRAAIEESIRRGFYPLVFLGGDDGSTCAQVPTPPTCGYVIARAALPALVGALQGGKHDLSPYVCVLPGWDGVFYGYTPAQVVELGNYFRTLLPNGCLGIEQQTGHIPVGEGGSDWAVGGRMTVYDLLLSEFNGWLPGGSAGDQVWQISARLLGPLYRRPSDQPTGDDPRPPYYLGAGTPRGPVGKCDFEFDTYRHVRGLDPAVVRAERAYLEAAGWPHCA